MPRQSPIDWWGIVHKLMVGVTRDGGFTYRAYTRQEIGRMTLRDLRLLVETHAPMDPRATPKAKTAAEAKALVAQKIARRDSWEPD